jgi:hypothetical protein
MPFRNPWYSANNQYGQARALINALRAGTPGAANNLLKLARGENIRVNNRAGGGANNKGAGGGANNKGAGGGANNKGAGGANNKGASLGFFRSRNKAGPIGKVNVNGTVRNVTKAANGTYYAAFNGNKFIRVVPTGIFGGRFGKKFKRANQATYSLNNQGMYRANIVGLGNTAQAAGLSLGPLMPGTVIGRMKVGNSNRNVYRSANNRYYATRNGQPNTNFYLLTKNGNNKFKYNNSSKNVYNRVISPNGFNFVSRPPAGPPPAPRKNTKNAIGNFIFTGKEIHKNLTGQNLNNQIARNYLTATRNKITPVGWNGYTVNYNTLRSGMQNNNSLKTTAHKNFWNAVNKLRLATIHTEVNQEGAYPLPRTKQSGNNTQSGGNQNNTIARAKAAAAAATAAAAAAAGQGGN